MRDVVKQAQSALNAFLTHMGMDEDEWNKPTFDQARAAVVACDAALARQAATPAVPLTDEEAMTMILEHAIPGVATPQPPAAQAPDEVVERLMNDIRQAAMVSGEGWHEADERRMADIESALRTALSQAVPQSGGLSDAEIEAAYSPFAQGEPFPPATCALKQAFTAGVRFAESALAATPAVCPECGGTGMRDSGGVHPWGEPAYMPCECVATLEGRR